MAAVHTAIIGFGDDVWSTTDALDGTGYATLDSPAAGDYTVHTNPDGDGTFRRTDTVSAGAGDLTFGSSYIQLRIKDIFPDTEGGSSFECRVHARTSEGGPYYLFAIDAGQLRCVTFDSGTATTIMAATAWDATNHEWVRLESDGTNVYFRTAPDSSGAPGSFTTQGSAPVISDVETDCRVYLQWTQASFVIKGECVLSAFNETAGGSTATISSAGGIASAEAFGTATLTARRAITGAGGIASAEAIGSPTVAWRSEIDLGGIASAEAFGTPSVTWHSEIVAGGIASAEAFGVSTLARFGLEQITGAGGITSAEAFGAAALSRDGIAAGRRYQGLRIGISMGI